MVRILCLIFTAMFVSAPAWGQEWAGVIGVHQTTADSNVQGTTVDGKLNFKVGALLGFELAEKTKFRTGLVYNRRHIDATDSGGNKYEYKFSYMDVPATLQYNINEMVGFFGGLVIAVNVGDDVDGPAGVTLSNPNAENMVGIMTAGVNLMFNDMIGFDFYYERGMGRFAQGLENHATFGGNFIYWF